MTELEVQNTDVAGHYLVQGSGGNYYHVTLEPDACECAWYMHTLFRQHVCKHVVAARKHVGDMNIQLENLLSIEELFARL